MRAKRAKALRRAAIFLEDPDEARNAPDYRIRAYDGARINHPAKARAIYRAAKKQYKRRHQPKYPDSESWRAVTA